MDLSRNDLTDSEDEIFFGKLSLKEVKIGLRKRICLNDKQRQTICGNPAGEETDTSIRLIETQSEPDYMSVRDSLMEDSPQKPCHLNKQSICSSIQDDSFLQLEEMVSHMPPEDGNNDALDNTLEVVEYILKHGPGSKIDNKHVNQTTDIKPIIAEIDELSSDYFKYESPMNLVHGPTLTPTVNISPCSPQTPKTETKHFTTPCKEANMRTPIFKTPANVLLPKKSSSIHKKTPSKNLQYQHIASPVASYIKNCPQTPLVQDVRPTKPLPGPSSSIPKFVKSNSQTRPCNKENTNLPSLAYKSAKNTKMINMPSAGKLPKSQWAKKIVSSLPRPVIIKHDHRENNSLKKVAHPPQEDSFADLSLHQADVSVCTLKSAFCKPKNGV